MRILKFNKLKSFFFWSIDFFNFNLYGKMINLSNLGQTKEKAKGNQGLCVEGVFSSHSTYPKDLNQNELKTKKTLQPSH